MILGVRILKSIVLKRHIVSIMANKNLSSFLTDLPQAKADTYANSGFRIIKKKSYNPKVNIPIITQTDGNYLMYGFRVKVKNL